MAFTRQTLSPPFLPSFLLSFFCSEGLTAWWQLYKEGRKERHSSISHLRFRLLLLRPPPLFEVEFGCQPKKEPQKERERDISHSISLPFLSLTCDGDVCVFVCNSLPFPFLLRLSKLAFTSRLLSPLSSTLLRPH